MAAGALTLSLQAAGAWTAERLAHEWHGSPAYGLTLASPRAGAFSNRPRDLRPPDAALAREVLAGRFPLAGAELDVGPGGDPWDGPSPSRQLAVQLHRFAWAPALVAEGGTAAAREALRLFLAWKRLFDRPSPFSWGAEVLERRVFNLACTLPRLAEVASDAETGQLAQSLARQARHLARVPGGPGRRAERLAAAAVAACTLAGASGERLLRGLLPRLCAALDEAVLPDGGLKTRSPEAAMELRFDLMTLDDVLLQRGRETPPAVSRAMDRLGGALRVFALADGRLAAFNGGGAGDPERVAAALAYDDERDAPFEHAPHSGYHRLVGGALQVIVDAGAPPPDGWSEAACAQPLSLEVVCGRDRLIANGGWTPDAAAPQALRLSAAGSTATLAETSPGQPLTGGKARALGARLVGGARSVTARREESEAGVWLELSHDGWAQTLGLIHERRLYLDPRADELRGEDRFTPVEGRGAVRRLTPYAVRFHLPPGVRVSLARDHRSVLLRGASDRGWWFRNDATEVLVEPSVVVMGDLPRRATQIVLKGQVDSREGARVRWKLAPVDTAPRSPAGAQA